jgi:HK97 family phage portal protein
VSAVKDGQPQYPVDDFVDNSMGAFGNNEVVYACIMEIASSLSEAPLQALDSERNPVKTHPTIDLLSRPNPFQSQFEFWEMTLLHMYLSGNAYWYKVRTGRGKIVELWALRPDRIRIVPDKDNLIKFYQYEIDGKMFPIDQNDILHHKFPNPHHDFMGMSPVRPALRRIATDNDLTDVTKNTLENGGMPSGILSTTDVMNEQLVRRMKAQWKQNYGGRNKGNIAILEGQMDFKPISWNMNELAMPDISALDETRICMVFGVPPILIGAKSGLDKATYANYKEARLSFWQETISSLQRRLISKLEIDQDLNPGGTFHFRFDDSDVDALMDIRQQNFENAIAGLNSGLLTHDEARAEVGLEPAPELAAERESEPKPEPVDSAVPSLDTNKQIEIEETKSLLQKKEEQIRLLEESGTLRAADEYFDRFRHWGEKELKKQGLQLKKLIEEDIEGQKHDSGHETKAIDDRPLDPSEESRLTSKINELELNWEQSAQKGIDPLMKGLMQQSGTDASALLKSDFNISNEEIIYFINEQKYKFAQSVSKSSADQAKTAIRKAFEKGQTIGELKNALKEVFVGPRAKQRATMIARTEVIRASNEGARAAYKNANVSQMRWIASSDPCPYCKGLDGKVVSVDKPFLTTEDTFQPKGASRPLDLKYGDIPSPPVHPGCRCTIIPEI